MIVAGTRAVTARPGWETAACRGADAPPTVSGMTTWEYATVPLLIHATKQILDNWGGTAGSSSRSSPGPDGVEQLVAYFKRPKG